MGFNSASSLKQWSTGKHVAPLETHYLHPSQPVFTFTSQCCVLRGEVTHTNVTVLRGEVTHTNVTVLRGEVTHTNVTVLRGEVTHTNVTALEVNKL